MRATANSRRLLLELASDFNLSLLQRMSSFLTKIEGLGTASPIGRTPSHSPLYKGENLAGRSLQGEEPATRSFFCLLANAEGDLELVDCHRDRGMSAAGLVANV
jgi:hypothetical protein